MVARKGAKEERAKLAKKDTREQLFFAFFFASFAPLREPLVK
jgi:hypothetical protein